MAVTSRFSNNSNLAYHTTLQISDAAATEVTKEIKYYASLPSIPTAMATPDSEFFRDRGKMQGMELGDDTVDFPEISIEIDLTKADVGGTTTNHSTWFSIMNLFMSPVGDGETTPLVSTNTGSVNVKNAFDPTTVTTPKGIKAVAIPADIDTLRLEMLFTNGTEIFGYRWEHNHPVGLFAGISYDISADCNAFNRWLAWLQLSLEF